MIAPGLRVGWLVAPQSVVEKVIRRKASNGIRNEYFPSVAYRGFRNCTISVAYRTVTKQLAAERDVIVRALNEQLHDKISFQIRPVEYTYGKIKRTDKRNNLLCKA